MSFINIINDLTYEQLKAPSGDLNTLGHPMPLWLRIADTAMCNIDLVGPQPGERFATGREDGVFLAKKLLESVLDHVWDSMEDWSMDTAEADDIIILRKLAECFDGYDEVHSLIYRAKLLIEAFDRAWPLALSHHQH